MSIQIQVRNKVAVNLTPEKVIVCGNSGYELEFLFDEEWESEEVKTARFVYRKGGQNYFDDVVFTGTTVNAPVLSGINSVLVGVYAGNLITTTPAVVECDKSILCGSGTHKDPTPDVYNQLIELINSGGTGGGGTGGTGADVFSPVANVTQTETGAVITITDKSGTTTATIVNGVDGKDGADGQNGKDGYTPQKGIDYFDGANGSDGKDGSNGKDGVPATHSWNGTTLTITSASGTSSANLKGDKGDKGETGANGTNGTSVTVKSVSESTADGGSNVVTFSDGKTLTVKNGSKGSTGATGQRGTGLLPVTTAPSAYTTAVNGLTPAYRIALSTVKSQASTTAVYAGDTIRQSYYHYPVIYVDSSYVYCGTRVSIRGATGAAGTTPVKGVDFFTDADKAEMVEDVKNSIDGLDELIGSGLEEVTYTPSLSGYMSVQTGAIVTGDLASKTFHTDYLALDGYNKIYAQYCLSSIGYAIAFFDASKQLLTNISVKGVGASGINIVEMDIPNEAVYCMLSCYNYDGNPAPNNYIKLIPVNGLQQRMDKLEEDMANFVSTSPLKGKTIAVLGDSISSVAYTVPNYWQMIAEKTGCTFLDYGISGSCLAVRTGSTTSFVERAANMEMADAVLVMGGTNDAGKDILLGEWASTDNTTLYGALNALISLLRTKYPGRPVIFCTPIKSMYVKDSGFPVTMADLKTAAASTNLELWHCALAIQAKCAVHGIPVIDLYNASGIGSQSSVFFREDDKLHPSILGECRIANMVQPILEQQFLYTTEYADEPEQPVEPEVSYTNLVPTSIDIDGTVYNGTGYKDDTRLSSSGGVSSSGQTGSATTGFMPYSSLGIIRIKGATWLNNTGHYYVNAYDENKTFTQGIAASDTQAPTVATYDVSTGITTIDMSKLSAGNVVRAAFGTATYIRINAYGKGADLIVTVNQEIT